MYYALFALHLIISVLLCVVVLLQQSKGGGLAGAFGGGGGGETLFGARGVTTFLHKATIYLGAAFMLSSVLLVVFSSRTGGGGDSLSREAAERAPINTAPLAIPDADFDPATPGLPVEGGVVPATEAGGDGSGTGEGGTSEEGGGR